MMYENYLEHHGIKGMRWGVRRYQNEDGTYTSEGKKRYISDKTRRTDRDIHSFDPYRRTGVKDKRGRELLSKEDVSNIRKAFLAQKAKEEARYSKKWDDYVAKVNYKKAKADAKSTAAAKSKVELEKAYAYADKNGISRKDYFAKNNRNINAIMWNYDVSRSEAKKLVKYSEMIDEYKTNKKQYKTEARAVVRRR